MNAQSPIHKYRFGLCPMGTKYKAQPHKNIFVKNKNSLLPFNIASSGDELLHSWLESSRSLSSSSSSEIEPVMSIEKDQITRLNEFIIVGAPIFLNA